MVEFDLSSLPAGTTITSAKLRLYVTSVANTGKTPEDITVYTTSGAWSQTTVTYSNQPGFSGTSLASKKLSDLTQNTWVEFTIPVATVQGWLTTPSTNHGFFLKFPSDSVYPYTSAGNFNHKAEFASSEHATDSQRPQLVLGCDFPNNAPVAQTQSVTVTEDIAKGITLQASDADGDPLTWSYTQPTNGTVSGTAPDVTYTPNAGYVGSDSFTFYVNDGTVDSNTATVSINVVSNNNVPVASGQSVTTPQDTAKAITLAASDGDGDPLTWTIVTNPTNGALSGTAPNLTYTPTAGFAGADSFTFKVNDGEADSNTATVSITVEPTVTNNPPIASGQTVITAEDTAKAITLVATDADGDPLTWTYAQPSNGTVSGTAPNVTYTPTTGFNGTDSFTFYVNDGKNNSNTATVTIGVTSNNNPPVADDQSLTVQTGSSLGITLTATDADGDPLTYVKVTDPANGTLSGTPPNVTYTPTGSYTGPDSFTFKASDGESDSNVATISINVTSVVVNTAPTADDQSVIVWKDRAQAITLSASDPQGDPLTWTVVSNPTNGTLSGTAPDLTYTPNAGYQGGDSFTFKVNDGSLDSNTATVSISVRQLAVVYPNWGSGGIVQGEEGCAMGQPNGRPPLSWYLPFFLSAVLLLFARRKTRRNSGQ